MPRKSLSSRIAKEASRRWNRWRVRLLNADKVAWIFAALLASVLVVFGTVLYSMVDYQGRQRSLRCLALNVYFEARGEPTAGKYAVAEVTMNRVASSRYPDTVCAVVYEKRWDRLRGRYVAAFSWTELNAVPEPLNRDWSEARRVAEDVYRGRHEALVDGALLFHATYVRPSWARGRKPVARIGGHLFYR